MHEELHLLILEDVASDAELMKRELRKAKIGFSAKRVQTKQAFLKGLKEFKPDLILAAHSVPSFDGLSALSMARQRSPDVPFIFVSGEIGEELAIEILKKGASEYVFKDRLSRLAPSVRRALRETEEGRERKQAKEALQCSENEQRALVEIARAVSAHLDREGLFHAIASVLGSVVSFDGMVILLPCPEEKDLFLYALETQIGKSYWHPGTTFPQEGTVPGWVLDHKRPYVGSSLEDLRPFPVSLDAINRLGMQSFCALPLLVEDRAVGVLIFNSKERGQYESADLSLLEEVTAVIALALDNCLAYEEIKRLKDQVTQENIYLQEEIKTQHNFEEIVGRSRQLKEVLKHVELVAPTDSSVLITGETGTGKELIARGIHHLSKRKNRPLIKVHCSTLPTGLIESELFGHEKGAFTGAISRRKGRFEVAHRGTIFLDEIGDVSPEVQMKLLRVLQDQEFERVGSTRTIKVNVRIIAATNRDLGKAVAENSFREDLYYRLNVFPIHLPPLRERKKDIPLLVEYVVKKYARRMGKRIEKISERTMRRLVAYPWPGNIRELENVIERAVILSRGSILEIGNESFLPSLTSPDQKDLDSRGKEVLTLQEMERHHIVKTLEKTGCVIEGAQGAAKILNLHPNTLRSRMTKLGIKRTRLNSS